MIRMNEAGWDRIVRVVLGGCIALSWMEWHCGRWVGNRAAISWVRAIDYRIGGLVPALFALWLWHLSSFSQSLTISG